MLSCLRGQEKGQDMDPENELFGKTIQIKSVHLEDIWKTDFSTKSKHLVEM